MNIIERMELIKKKPVSIYLPGSVERVFEYNEKCSRNESGELPVFIKPDPVEQKKKKILC